MVSLLPLMLIHVLDEMSMTLIVSDQGYYDSRPLCPKGNDDCHDHEYGL
jgi:hypothetical protein